MKSILAITAVGIVILIALFVTRLGYFHDVAIRESEMGPYTLIYKSHLGAYHKIVPVIEEVETWVKKAGDPCRLSFGEYIDDPELVAEDRLRSNGGCVVEKPFAELVASGSDLPTDLKSREVLRRGYVVADFDGAPSIGPLRVYPRAKAYIKDHGFVLDGPVFEMYEVLPDQRVKTTYLFPVKR